jgi:hypothetical protein
LSQVDSQRRNPARHVEPFDRGQALVAPDGQAAQRAAPRGESTTSGRSAAEKLAPLAALLAVLAILLAIILPAHLAASR